MTPTRRGGRLLCAWCNPSGARPAGGNSGNTPVVFFGPVRLASWFAATRPTCTPPACSPPTATASSSTAPTPWALATPTASPTSMSGRPREPAPAPPPPLYSPQNGGCIDLISSGQSTHDSEFLEASPNGNDVFFTTLQSLVPADFGLVDVYDARVDGGFRRLRRRPPNAKGKPVSTHRPHRRRRASPPLATRAPMTSPRPRTAASARRAPAGCAAGARRAA